MENTIQLSPADITLLEFKNLSLSDKLILTADYVEEYLEQGGKIAYWGIRDIASLCPAKVVLLKLTGIVVTNDDSWHYVNEISEEIYIPSSALHDHEAGCIATPDNLRKLAAEISKNQEQYA
jgi:hypothetical protein